MMMPPHLHPLPPPAGRAGCGGGGEGGGRGVLEGGARGRVVEVGAGTGKNLPYYPERAFVVASDLSPGMLARAVEKARDRSRAVRFVVTDAEDLAFRDGAFDTVLATCVFCTVPD